MRQQDTKIVGIILVKNEDIFIKQVVLNIINFCDLIFIADNMSSDQTYEIGLELAERFQKIECCRISHPRESHKLIERYAGTRTWIFGVDGDEIYDPVGLHSLRKKLLSGDFDNWWMILANMLHCVKLDFGKMKGQGYIAPPCRSVSKLYNFGLISEWSDCPHERLHNGNLVFRSGYDATLRFPLYEQFSWENSCFRGLHTCFMARSSLETTKKDGRYINARKNPAEIAPFRGPKGFLRFFWYKYKKIPTRAKWKTDWYMKGDLIIKDITFFFANKEAGAREWLS